MSTGAKLKELRGKKSQQEAADGIGITKSALAMYERDERIPRDEVKVRIAAYYGVSVLFLFFNGGEH
jgi:transcriptional regulator with XRE-family HTH domain